MPTSRVTLSAIACILATTSAAWALQDAASTSSDAAPAAAHLAAPDTAAFSAQDLARFARAHRDIQNLQAEYARKLQAAGDDRQKAAEVWREAANAMRGAVQASGMSVPAYNDMIEVARADPAVAERIQAEQQD